MRIKINETIEAEIRFTHNRQHQPPQTSATVTFREGEEITRVLAGSVALYAKDQYCYRTGRKAALVKVLADLNREHRRIIWQGLKEKGVRLY